MEGAGWFDCEVCTLEDRVVEVVEGEGEEEETEGCQLAVKGPVKRSEHTSIADQKQRSSRMTKTG